MSVEAMSWALNQQAVTDPAARAVLFGLANHAHHDGKHAFPSVSLLCRYTGLAPRTVKSKLKLLVELKLIRKGNQRVVAAIIERADRRPTVYDLDLNAGLDLAAIEEDERGACDAPREVERGATDAPREGNGVHLTAERGATDAPEPSLTINPSLSDAGEAQSNIFEQAAQQADDGEPAADDLTQPRKTAMHLDWEPEPETYAASCWQRGLAPDANVHAALLDFREHFAAQPERTNTHADWTRRFVRWVFENQQRQQTAVATAGGNHANRRNSTPKRRLTAQEARAAHEGRAPEPPGRTYEGEWASTDRF
ncbi:helix-turn-helix domain-containing protein [Halomonas sp. KHS3]|uniref:helix-turn-helix domain-containing protein n=1 Tax=Halomonas sp. KHS3 TaxID=866350 RepID=UPI000695EC14|nr:helix-turn-helix domain-containing protein [Halomonas sp. KHS3]